LLVCIGHLTSLPDRTVPTAHMLLEEFLGGAQAAPLFAVGHWRVSLLTPRCTAALSG